MCQPLLRRNHLIIINIIIIQPQIGSSEEFQFVTLMGISLLAHSLLLTHTTQHSPSLRCDRENIITGESPHQLLACQEDEIGLQTTWGCQTGAGPWH